jgi:hypothetical protein
VQCSALRTYTSGVRKKASTLLQVTKALHSLKALNHTVLFMSHGNFVEAMDFELHHQYSILTGVLGCILSEFFHNSSGVQPPICQIDLFASHTA